MHANAASAGIVPLETEGTGERTVAVVVNPTKIGDMGDLKAVVEQAAADAGYSATRWYGTTPDDPGAGQTRAALAEGPAVVIAAGGDGTVRVPASDDAAAAALLRRAVEAGVEVVSFAPETGSLEATYLAMEGERR